MKETEYAERKNTKRLSDPDNTMNIRYGSDGSNWNSIYTLSKGLGKDNFRNLTFEDVVSNRFLSYIVGVAYLFQRVGYVRTNILDSSYASNDVFTWLEGARLYNGGDKGETNLRNRWYIRAVQGRFSDFEPRYNNRIQDYWIYVKRLRDKGY